MYKTRNMNERALHYAATNCDLCRMVQLIEAGVSLDSLDEEKQTPLHVAAKFGLYEVAALLIESKCNINLEDRCGRTPVVLAAERGKKDIVHLLLHRGAQVNCVDDKGYSLLHWASCRTGWADIARLILDNGGADLNAVNRGGETPLILAARYENQEVAALLIRAGADVNRSDNRRNTALRWAAMFGHSGVIQILLEKEGLDLSPQDVNGNTPLHLATDFYCRDVIKQLLDAGADSNMKNNQGRTALSECIWYLRLTHKEIRLFVQKGAFLEDYDYDCISQDSFLKENVLKDVELCTQSVVNKFHRQSLPALNSITYLARRLPNVNNFKLGARQIDEVENLVKCEIEKNTFCNVVKVHPIALSALCVLSLITCHSSKK